MQLSLIYSKPSAILRALTEARLLMANHARELTEAMDELIVVTSEYIDAQGKVQEPGNQEDRARQH
jgi:ABC-type transport system involved in cytochrome bd biosynthesis fused ATPase/permease subunit